MYETKDATQPQLKLGDRVAFIKSFTDTNVLLYGFGVYLGNCVVDEMDKDDCPLLDPNNDFADKVALDDGVVVYGPEGFLRPLETLHDFIYNRKVIFVDVLADREEYFKDEPVQAVNCPFVLNINLSSKPN